MKKLVGDKSGFFVSQVKGDDQIIFFPWRPISHGYVVPNKKRAKKMADTQKYYAISWAATSLFYPSFDEFAFMLNLTAHLWILSYSIHINFLLRGCKKYDL